MKYPDLEGKTVMITGAAKGIGLAIARAFAEQGSRPVLVCRREFPDPEQFKGGLEPILVKSDVRDLESLRAWLAGFEAQGGRVDVLVNNAGVVSHQLLLEASQADWDFHMDTNLKAVMFLSQLLARHMKTRGGGAVVSIASFNSHVASVAEGLYAVSKAALAMLTRSMAAEWAPHGIRVNAVSPGMIPTPMSQAEIETQAERLLSYISLNRFGRTEEIAQAVVFLASEAASYITGHNLDVNGGKALVQDPPKAWELAGIKAP